MKTITLLLAALSIALAPTASATPGEDQALLYILRQRKMYVGDQGITSALELAHVVCQMRGRGINPVEIQRQMRTTAVPVWTPHDAEFFYGAATMVYCPELNA
jgi:hypothetical protein